MKSKILEGYTVSSATSVLAAAILIALASNDVDAAQNSSVPHYASGTGTLRGSR